MKRFSLILAALLSFTAHADEAVQEAATAGVTDCGTTAVVLAAGFVEGNPLGAPLACMLKAPVVAYANTLQEPARTQTLSTVSSFGYGAAASNLALFVGAGPWAPAVGLVVAVYKWQESADLRERAYLCSSLRQYAGKPEMPCTFL